MEQKTSNEEAPSLEEILEEAFDRLNILEDAFLELQEAFNELSLDHQALFTCMRNTGKFSRNAFRTARSILVREQVAEMEMEDVAKNNDGESPEGDDWGQEGSQE